MWWALGIGPTLAVPAACRRSPLLPHVLPGSWPCCPPAPPGLASFCMGAVPSLLGLWSRAVSSLSLKVTSSQRPSLIFSLTPSSCPSSTHHPDSNMGMNLLAVEGPSSHRDDKLHESKDGVCVILLSVTRTQQGYLGELPRTP